MKGFAGSLRLDGGMVAPGVVERIARATAPPGGALHRFHAGSVAIACINGEEPFSNPAPAVFDGYLDNATELAKDLGLPPRTSPAKLVVWGYRQWGPAVLERLQGHFALALWDAPTSTLLCATDRFAACQLYHTSTSDAFYFATTEEAMRQVPGFCSAPDEEAIARLFAPGLTPPTRDGTWLKDVRQLEPAHLLVIAHNNPAETRRYWSFARRGLLQFSSQQAAQEEFISIFTAAVAAQAGPHGPALFLSGGLDSATIRTCARLAHPARAPHTYSAVSDSPQNSVETRSILAMTVGADARLVCVPSFEGEVSVSELVTEAWSRPHPRDNSILLVQLLCLAAARHGEDQMLIGASGDVVLTTPWRYPAALLRRGEWRQAWHECAHASRNHTYLKGTPAARLLSLNLWTAFMPHRARSMLHTLLGRVPGRPSPTSISPDFERRLRIRERLQEQRSEAHRSRAAATDDEEFMIQMLENHGALRTGLTGARQIGKRYGLNLFDPFAHPRVVDFLTRLPMEFKVRCGWDKYLVRGALTPYQPPEVLWRTDKTHLGWLFVRKLVSESMPVIESLLEESGHLAGPYCELGPALRSLAKIRGKHPDTVDYEDQKAVFEVATVAGWLKGLSSASEFR